MEVQQLPDPLTDQFILTRLRLAGHIRQLAHQVVVQGNGDGRHGLIMPRDSLAGKALTAKSACLTTRTSVR
jgi:hypothetical protein